MCIPKTKSVYPVPVWIHSISRSAQDPPPSSDTSLPPAPPPAPRLHSRRFGVVGRPVDTARLLLDLMPHYESAHQIFLGPVLRNKLQPVFQVQSLDLVRLGDGANEQVILVGDLLEKVCVCVCARARQQVCSHRCVRARQQVCSHRCARARQQVCSHRCARARQQVCSHRCVRARQQVCSHRCARARQQVCSHRCARAHQQVCSHRCARARQQVCSHRCARARQQVCSHRCVRARHVRIASSTCWPSGRPIVIVGWRPDTRRGRYPHRKPSLPLVEVVAYASEGTLARRAKVSTIPPRCSCSFPHFLSPCWGPPRRQG